MYYLKLSRIITLASLFLLFVGSTMNAQCSYPVVATQCVGTCGSPSEINYTVTQPCIAKWRKYCVVNENTSICPNTNVFVAVFVDGVYVTSGNITALGSEVGFAAECGSNIKVIASTYYVGGGVVCVWLGNLKYSLRQA